MHMQYCVQFPHFRYYKLYDGESRERLLEAYSDEVCFFHQSSMGLTLFPSNYGHYYNNTLVSQSVMSCTVGFNTHVHNKHSLHCTDRRVSVGTRYYFIFATGSVLSLCSTARE